MMKLTFKKTIFSLLDHYKVYDENHQFRYLIKSGILFGSLYQIFDTDKNRIGYVKTKMPPFHSSIILYENGVQIGQLIQKSTFQSDEYDLSLSSWSVDKNLLNTRYSIFNQGSVVANIEKDKNVFYIDIDNENDAIKVLLVVLAIEGAKSLNLYQ